MLTMNVSLPDEMRDFVERRVREGSFRTSGEYIRALILRDEATTLLRERLLEGIESPEVARADSAYFAAKREAASVNRR